jgi:hypothetical protein
MNQVEELAKLLHESAREWHRLYGPQEGINTKRPWEEVPEWQREKYRHAARAVFIHLFPDVVVVG